MITVEIIKSNFKESLGIYEYQFDEIFIGRSKKADLIFNDSELPNKFLTIKIKANSLVVFNEKDSIHYFVNAKKLNGQRKLMINDCIQFGTHEIKIISFERTQQKNEKSINIQQHLNRFNSETPEQKFILNFLEEEIIRLEAIARDDNV